MAREMKRKDQGDDESLHSEDPIMHTVDEDHHEYQEKELFKTYLLRRLGRMAEATGLMDQITRAVNVASSAKGGWQA